MGYRYQLVIDSGDPHVLAAWWAETMGWQVEPQDAAFIRSMVEQGHASEAETRVYEGALVWREAVAIHPIAEETPDRPRWLFQAVPEAKTVKNRLHVDIRVGSDADLVAVRASLVARGATVLHEGRRGPHAWVTFADPEGNEFCA